MPLAVIPQEIVVTLFVDPRTGSKFQGSCQGGICFEIGESKQD